MKNAINVMVLFLVVIFFLTGLPVNAQQLQPVMAVQVTKTKERIKSGQWFPIFLSLTTNDVKDEEFAFTASTRDNESMAFQGLGLKVRTASIGINNLTDMQFASLGVDDEKDYEQKKDLSMIPDKAWHKMMYVGGVCFGSGGVKIKTDKMPIGGNPLAMRIKHKDDKDWTYFLFIESCKDVPGELQTAYVLYIQKAPDGYDPLTWSPEKKFRFTRGFTYYKATSSDPEEAARLAYARLPKLSNPVISPNGGSHVGSVKVSIMHEKDAVIRVTCDGSDPDAKSSVCGGFTVNKSCTVKIKAFQEDYRDSDIVSADFIITQPPPLKAEKPTIVCKYVNSSCYGPMAVTMSAKEIIRLTVDGTEPTEASAQYVGPFAMDASGVVKAKTFAAGFTESDTACAEVTVQYPPSVRKTEERTEPPKCAEEESPACDNNEVKETCEYGIVDLDLIGGESNGFEAKTHGSDANSKGKIFATVLGTGLKDTVDFCDRKNVFSFDHLTGITLTKVPSGVLSIHFLDESESSCWHIRKDKSDPCIIVKVGNKRFVRWNIKSGQHTHITLERGKNR